MNCKGCIVIITFKFCISTTLISQEKYLFQSTIVDEEMEAIGGVFIKNLRSNSYAVSDSTGWFSIACSASDSLLISGLGYEIEVIQVSRLAHPFIQLRMILHRLRQVDVYEFGAWESFVKDFVNLNIEGEKVNTSGLPKGSASPRPAYLRPNTYESSPGLMGILTPVSTITYFTSRKEKEKRKVWKMMELEKSESTYWRIVHSDSIQVWLDVPDTLIDDFVIYCNSKITNKGLISEAQIKDEIARFYLTFIEEKN